MAKRYGLDSIIGKKSRIRFSRSVTHTKIDTISGIISANNVLSEPPFSTAITMKKGDSLDICDQLNELSYEYDENFPIKTDILISNGGTLIDFKTPTVFSLLNILYDIEDTIIEKLRANIPQLSIILANIGLAKINTQEEIFLLEIKNSLRTIFSNLNTYNCRRRKDKKIKALSNKIRKESNIKNFSKSTKYVNKRNLHFFVKTKRSNKKEKLPMLFDAIEVFYDLYEDWDEYFDEYYQDYYLESYDDMIISIVMDQDFFLLKKKIEKKLLVPQILYVELKFNKLLSEKKVDLIDIGTTNMSLPYMLLDLEKENGT